MGIAILAPSGMLCKATAIAKPTPTMGVAKPTMNVAIPSGKLWMAMEVAVDS